MSDVNNIVQGLYRAEFSRMVAVISKLFGLKHIEMAEDIVSETFLAATENWARNGLPENPVAWLYLVAKQKTIHQFRRQKIFDEKIIPRVKTSQETVTEADVDFSPENIRDNQLQMMFAVCNPAIASEAQIALALRILCGFSIDEIAQAFLSNKETINKRLHRAKEKLRTENAELEMPTGDEIGRRLENVLHITYLLFNEGYYSSTQNETLRRDLCLEALRLGLLLTDFPATNKPATNALVALMCFHASRFDARQSDGESLILYDQQDESLWNRELIARGEHYLHDASQGDEISSYHLEAGIAFWHCHKEDTIEKWEAILDCYNLLLQINYSPVAALNRTYALYKARGKEEALKEAKKLALTGDRFYYALLGELYSGIDDKQAYENLRRAHELAKTEEERKILKKKMDFCRKV
ncbi:MAG TPA: sigma-70 family RNA polymerase sigma factor [Chitinophagaceae bacterium]